MDLLTIRYQSIASQGIVVFPARQLSDPAHCAVDGTQARPIALSPDHPFVVCRADLSTALYQGAVGIEEQLGIVEGAAVALVDADGHYNAGLLGGFGDGAGGFRWHGNGLF